MKNPKLHSSKLSNRGRILKVVFVTACLGWIFLCAAWIFISSRVSTKESYPSTPAFPSVEAAPAIPDLQLESHTCGYHSLVAIYRAYGLDPEAENLRFRLGVDVDAIPGDKSSKGSLQPDIYRVLAKDQFQFSEVMLEDRAADGQIAAHLESGHKILFLIARRQNGNLHWVVGDRINPSGDLLIVDSLSETPYSEIPSDFFSECVLSAILIEPAPAGAEPSGDFKDLYSKGLLEMKRVAFRQTARRK